MYRRKYIVFKVLEALKGGKSSISFPSPDPAYDQEHIGRMFKRKDESVRINKDAEKGELTFTRRKK